MARLLIADDEADFRRSVSEYLRLAGHEVVECADALEASKALEERTFDVVLTDVRMPGGSGIEVLRKAARRLPDCILIVMTAYGALEDAIEALHIGAHEFLLKPLRFDRLAQKIERLVQRQTLLAEARLLRGALGEVESAEGLVGASEAMKRVYRLIARVAPTDSTVLIKGETGTGKELVSRAIHLASARRDQPFVAVNCGSIPEPLLESQLFGHVRGAFTGADRDKPGLFEVAAGGTIFLDEIGELPVSMQPKLLRAVEDREVLRVGSTQPTKVAARIVAATHRDLAEMIGKGLFRSDLYYRVNVFEIVLPPLRERKEDIATIAVHLLDRLCRRMRRLVPVVEPDALAVLESYAWPGNVRELANVLERALILTEGKRIGVEDLVGMARDAGEEKSDELRPALRTFERAHVRAVLGRHGGDKKKAAAALGIDLSSLYRKLEG